MAAIVQWNDNRCKQAYQLALLGATEAEMAAVMGVNIGTIEYWKRTRTEFLEALNNGKTQADAKVVESLFRAATGYEYTEEVSHVCRGEVIVTRITKYKTPDPWSAVKWLSLRRRADWSETHRVEVTNTNININRLDFSGMTNEELKLMANIGLKQLDAHDASNN